jgi:predicted nucleotidyltransferase
MVLLRELSNSKLVKVTGSYARGNYHVGSDIDFVVKHAKIKRDGTEGPRPITSIIQILENHGVKWDSELVGHVFTPRNLEYMPIPIEFIEEGWLAPIPKEEREEEVSIFGCSFKTW